MEPIFHALNDRALLATFSRQISEEANDLVLRLSHDIEQSHVPGLEEAQPTYGALCLHFDPAVVAEAYLKSFIKMLLGKYKANLSIPYSSQQPGRLVEIPVKYGGDFGPDLLWAGEHLGMSPEEIVRRHSARNYRVYMIGFTPGFPYLGGMDESIALPRLEEPRKTVPAGSVGIAGSQTGVYPWDTPGGWRLLGRTPIKLFDAQRNDPSFIKAGDTVRFVPVSEHAIPQKPQREPPPTGTSHGLGVPTFLVEHPGFFSLIVDSGRFGYRKIGVPVSGAADTVSYGLANRAAGNRSGTAALEMTLWGCTLRALCDTTVAVSGSNPQITVDGKEMKPNEPIAVKEGNTIQIGPMSIGCRSYLAVAGGFSVLSVLGSFSTYIKGGFGGLLGRPVKSGDVLHQNPWPGRAQKPQNLQVSAPDLSNSSPVSLYIYPGPEATAEALKTLCGSTYTVRPESDRMGLRLDGPRVSEAPADILSSAVVPGVIQVTSDGKPVLLLCDAQTTGGYTRLGCVVSKHLPQAGQLRPGAQVRFVLADRT